MFRGNTKFSYKAVILPKLLTVDERQSTCSIKGMLRTKKKN